jgi:ribosomal-protein-alanine N-acetyltransferase
MDLCPAHRELHTPRLLLQAGHEGLAAALCDYQSRNRAHFAPWDPPTPASFYGETAQAERIRTGLRAFAEGSALRWWLSPLADPGRVVGTVHISQIARGAFHSAVLGYGLDAELQGHGLMHEALGAAIAEAFSLRVNLHRLQAAWRPENLRSGAVLQRLGFEREGLARHYLFIDGAWRDHCIASLHNPGFRPPSGWAAATAP